MVNMKQANYNILRWILFIPVSVIVSEIIKYFVSRFCGNLFGLFSAELGETIDGIISWTFTAIVLIVVAYEIVPSHKKATMKIYAIVWSFLCIVWTIYNWFLAKEEVLGSFWYPLILNISFVIGLWATYLRLFYLKDQKKITNGLT